MTNSKFKHPCPTSAELRTLAHRQALDKWELVELIQGFCPNKKIGKGVVTYLDEHDETYRKFKAATQGRSFPMKPSEALLLCIQHDIPLPIEFSEAVRESMFITKRPKISPRNTDELIKGSTSDSAAKIYESGRSKPGRKNKKIEPAIRGYESIVLREARDFCISYLEKHGALPRKKIINAHLAKKMKRSEDDLSRAYSLGMVMTSAEKSRALRTYRRGVQENFEFSKFN